MPPPLDESVATPVPLPQMKTAEPRLLTITLFQFSAPQSKVNAVLADRVRRAKWSTAHAFWLCLLELVIFK